MQKGVGARITRLITLVRATHCSELCKTFFTMAFFSIAMGIICILSTMSDLIERKRTSFERTGNRESHCETAV